MKNELIDALELTYKRKQEQLDNNEDTRSTKYIPFNERYDVKTINYGLYFLIELGAKANDDRYVIPEYQRELVWNLKNKQNLIFSIMNGSPIGEFIIAKDTVNKKQYYHIWTIIDGQQRINTLKEFVLNKFKDLDGRYFKDYSYREMTYLCEGFTNFNIITVQDLTLKEQVEIYLAKNVGGVIHTEEQLEKARQFL